MTKYAHAVRGVVILTLLALTCALSACTSARPTPPSVVSAPPIVWQVSPPSFASGPAGVIALRRIEIMPPQFRIYFVFKPSSQADAQAHPITLHITASSSLAAKPTTPAVPLTATIQTLGQIGAYSIGVMHIQHLNRADQVVTVAITPSLPGAATWRLSPIHQLIVEPHAQTAYGELVGFSDGLPEAQWSPPVQAQLVSYVKVIIPGQPIADRTYVFVRSDDPVNVQVISKAQYIALAGGENFTP
jgi:hypothetical protein